MQTTDEATLEAIARQNISTDAYLALAASLRRRNHALVGDLIIGLPGQTYRSFVNDLQFMLDHEIMPRTFPLRMLPNSPINEPAYRERHGVRVNEAQVVAATSTLSEADRARVVRMHDVEIVAERAGLLRHIMRYLQWDLELAATDVLERIVEVCDESPEDHPLLAWAFTMFDLVPTVPVGWASFYAEVVQFLDREFGIADNSALRTVVAVQQAVMPATGRDYPATIQIPHDYVAYYASATRSLHTTGRAGVPDRPLAAYPPASFTVAGDPLDLGVQGLDYRGDTRAPQSESDFHTGSLAANELDSPLLRRLPPLAGFESPSTRQLRDALALPPDDGAIPEEGPGPLAGARRVSQPVSLRRGRPLHR